MIRVLEDLQTYARLHRLNALAEHLDQARFLAMTEIANLPRGCTDPDVENAQGKADSAR
jgi:hypothetical protein